jgi:leader peptidase (prepilin peptidase)/N-methyltransferase
MERMALLSLSFQLVAFWWGAIFGSFLNVAIYRMPYGLSLVRPPSRCGACGTSIRWYDNIPVLSYLLLRGRCRACGTTYSARYALIEAVTGVLTLAVWNNAVMPLSPDTFIQGSLTWIWLSFFIFSLIVITFIDLEHTFIPDEISYPLIGFGLFGAFTLPTVDGVACIIGAVAGGGFLLLVWAVSFAIYRREAMGLGDAKLLAAIGAFVGWQALPVVLLGASLSGIAASGVAHAYTRITGKAALNMTTTELDERFGESELYADQPERLALPFGPFLALGALYVVLFGTDAFYTLIGLLTPFN